jgi:ubiquinol-cytochrome c reductase cytochrome b subunit
LPFILAALSILHISVLHASGSNCPLGVKLHDNIPFYPYFFYKDLFGFFLFTLLFGYLILFDSNLLGHPDNYIKANALVTPTHIVPE